MTGTVQYPVSSLQTFMLAPICAVMLSEITQVWLNGHRVADSAVDYLGTSALIGDLLENYVLMRDLLENSVLMGDLFETSVFHGGELNLLLCMTGGPDHLSGNGLRGDLQDLFGHGLRGKLQDLSGHGLHGKL